MSSHYNLRSTSNFKATEVPTQSKSFDAVVTELKGSFTTKVDDDPTPVCIIHNLYWGSERALQSSFLQDQHIQVIINIGSKPPSSEQQRLLKDYYYVPLSSSNETEASILPWQSTVVAWIDRACRENQSVLIYSRQGRSRSAAFLCMYLMQYHSYSLESAIVMLRQKRSCCCIQDSFVRQLNDLSATTTVLPRRWIQMIGLVYIVLLLILGGHYWLRSE